MTYKNIKFEDSAVFRSLEKLAVNKGLIKPDEFKKEASAKPAPSLSPTKDVSENILKLCSGLRSQGFESYATELERKFLALKQAENMMEVAHPEGSVKLPDMEGDATVEDFEEQKKKIEEIIKKTPKGKFGKDILNVVKVTLAQAAPETKESLLDEQNKNLEAALVRWKKIDQMISEQGGLINGLGIVGRGMEYSIESSAITKILSNRNAIQPELEEVKSRLNNVLRIIKPGISLTQWNPFGGTNSEVYNTVAGSIQKLDKYIDNALRIRSKIQDLKAKEIDSGDESPAQPTAKPATSPVSKAESDIDQYIATIKSWLPVLKIKKDLNAQEKATASQWVNDQVKEFGEVLAAWKSIPDAQKPGAYSQFTQRFDGMKQECIDFYNEWVK